MEPFSEQGPHTGTSKARDIAVTIIIVLLIAAAGVLVYANMFTGKGVPSAQESSLQEYSVAGEVTERVSGTEVRVYDQQRGEVFSVMHTKQTKVYAKENNATEVFANIKAGDRITVITYDNPGSLHNLQAVEVIKDTNAAPGARLDIK